MIVWIVTETYDGDGTEIVGVFSTRESAMNTAREIIDSLDIDGEVIDDTEDMFRYADGAGVIICALAYAVTP